MVKVREQPYKRGRENYHIEPEEKARYWEQIVEAAKVVIANGGADIRISVDIGESERLYREMKAHGKEK